MSKILLALALLGIAALVYAKARGGENVLPPKEFVEKHKAEGGVLLDVRTPEEYTAGHVAGAENINFYDPGFAEKIAGKDKQQTYFVYCRSGGRSGKTAAMMKEAGFTKVYDMAGGMNAYEAAKLPVEK